MILSSMAFAISLSVSAIKLVGWLAHADTRALIRIGRWLLIDRERSFPCAHNSRSHRIRVARVKSD